MITDHYELRVLDSEGQPAKVRLAEDEVQNSKTRHEAFTQALGANRGKVVQLVRVIVMTEVEMQGCVK